MASNYSNVTNNATDYIEWIQATQYWAWTLTTIGGLGNMLNILVILHQLCIGHTWKNRPWDLRRRDSSPFRSEKPVLPFEGHTLLLLHLCFCDLLYSAVSLPLTATAYGYALSNETEKLDALCPAAAFVRYTNALAEWLTLGLLAFQRCVDLGRRRNARFFRPGATGLLIAGIWLVSIALQVIPFAMEEGYGYSRENFKCDVTNEVLRIIFYALQSLLPCVLMLIGCIGILYQLRRYTKEMEDINLTSSVSKQRLVRSSILVLTLLLLFLVCVVPICVHNLLPKDHFGLNTHIPHGIVIYMIYWLQYAVNFILYNIMSANFRSAYRRFFGLVFPVCRSRINPTRPGTSSVYSVTTTQTSLSRSLQENRFVRRQSGFQEMQTRY
ncbi:galanin receptor type 1-like [Penaeus japonicus]|uniref:galanin receptor type 1-like n=1 Tax=Penaeus japonicus TaxID=27405 RepID=UPI001C7100C3|nr:galanin receptor type 1-like [Penaeus japonicus]